MKISKISMVSGNINTMDLDITQEQLDFYQNGNGLIQNVFPHLDADEREFLMTGMTPEEWETVCAEPSDDDQEDE